MGYQYISAYYCKTALYNPHFASLGNPGLGLPHCVLGDFDSYVYEQEAMVLTDVEYGFSEMYDRGATVSRDQKRGDVCIPKGRRMSHLITSNNETASI
ncbi:MAG TPA: hypothetical protein GX524_06325 [Firmicutes bacterium]|nr:hypothetical protein [Bacillota bacterium]